MVIETLDNPTTTTVGKKGRLRVVQPTEPEGRTLAYGTSYEFAAGTAPTLSTGADSQDVLYYDTISSTRILMTSVLGVK